MEDTDNGFPAFGADDHRFHQDVVRLRRRSTSELLRITADAIEAHPGLASPWRRALVTELCERADRRGDG